MYDIIPCRIPAEWKPIMEDFWKEYQDQVHIYMFCKFPEWYRKFGSMCLNSYSFNSFQVMCDPNIVSEISGILSHAEGSQTDL